MYGQSFRTRTTETWSPKGTPNGAGRHQRYGLRIFLTASVKAAVHLGKDYEENLRVTRKTEFFEIRHLFSNYAEMDP